MSTREQAEVALRESESRFRATFEQAAVGMSHVAPDGQWLLVNQRLCDIVGYTRLIVLGDDVRGEQLRLRVADQGIGIPPTALAQLFQRFYRAPNAGQQHAQGLGVGLYVIREIVALHGGSVEVMSAEGQGSTFTVQLPLA